MFRATLLIVMALAAPAAAFQGPTDRTVFVSITDRDGQPVEGLTSADVVVKEGGKAREVKKIGPASERMRLALALEERIAADSLIRRGVLEFMKRVSPSADIALLTVGMRVNTVVHYTPDLDALVAGLQRITHLPAQETAIPEAVVDLSKALIEAKAKRPVIVLVALTGGQAGVNPRPVLDKLRDSGATMQVVTLEARGGNAVENVQGMYERSTRERVMSDGPGQSGGRRIDLTETVAVARALDQIANDLLAQQEVTYVLPAGVKPQTRFDIDVKRRGVTVRAPSHIPER